MNDPTLVGGGKGVGDLRGETLGRFNRQLTFFELRCEGCAFE